MISYVKAFENKFNTSTVIKLYLEAEFTFIDIICKETQRKYLIIKLTNAIRKAAKHNPNLTNPWTEYANINFFNISMSALRIFGTFPDSFLQMLNDLNFNQNL